MEALGDKVEKIEKTIFVKKLYLKKLSRTLKAVRSKISRTAEGIEDQEDARRTAEERMDTIKADIAQYEAKFIKQVPTHD